jgi:hypothetical protein
MPRLTEQEQQEIVRFIEAGRPLPDKYRFLLFEDKREVELVWNGKTNEVCNIVLPFQVIEQVDEPRAEKPEDTSLQLGLFDTRGRQMKGWTNKLIWGDNKLILSSLKNGTLREEIEKQAGLKLTLTRPSTWARISAWTSRSAATPLPKSPTSWKRSPTATPGVKARILSSP